MINIYPKIDSKNLSDWITNWDEDKFIDFLKNRYPDVNPVCYEIYKDMIRSFKGRFYDNKNSKDIDSVMGSMSPNMLYCFFKIDNSSIKVANFFEALLLPSDLHTQKSFIKGFDDGYLKKGRIDLRLDGKIIGEIGSVSDLFHLVFFENFFKDNECETIHIDYIEKYISIQIWDNNINDHNNFIEKILYYCSKYLNLNFKRIKLNELQKIEGEAPHHLIDVPKNNLDIIPLLYYNLSNYSTIPRMIFLSYYQSIEYFFVKAKNILLQEELVNANIADPLAVNFDKVYKSVTDFIKNSREKRAIELVIEKSININNFLNELHKPQIKYYIDENILCPFLKRINISTERNFLSTISERIYSVRCSIVHSKGETTKFSFIPNINDNIVENEIPLIKIVATNVIEFWGDKSNIIGV